MINKKILIISYSYPPSNVPAVQRPYNIAKYLDKDNFDVTVIACANFDASWGINEGFDPELPKVNLIKINSLLGRGTASLKVHRSVPSKTLISDLKSSIISFASSLVVMCMCEIFVIACRALSSRVPPSVLSPPSI